MVGEGSSETTKIRTTTTEKNAAPTIKKIFMTSPLRLPVALIYTIPIFASLVSCLPLTLVAL
ncbi:hypothetical protein HNQ77_001046 [Silvibacterium bohemicum]|uniref:Uncharacterized protein n=1 Tax=Silvibacterium bohemicum TaxID=1577686 RepID=A0A841JP17_9BACT|nr:hypothetical protein [Silvibacterium bohemicum]